jgi:hypothetical protein
MIAATFLDSQDYPQKCDNTGSTGPGLGRMTGRVPRSGRSSADKASRTGSHEMLLSNVPLRSGSCHT